ncbi:reverse transcriptase domain-containing protein [Brevundimonas sp.]|uniref:reverse transcriptase domain-containing protein n=1 Tax=Brevundimonas sp. TaxID=1871086 RepID=UPI003A92EE42
MTRRLPKAFSDSSLRETWRKSRDGRGYKPGGPGIDRVTADQFGSHLAANLGRIRRDLGRAEYRLSPLKPHLLAKGDGFRVLAIPTVQDRLVQRAVVEHLDADPRFNVATPISFGFRRGFGIEMAHTRALALRKLKPWVLKVDIVQFFDRLDRSILLQKIKPIRSPAIRDLLAQAIASEIDKRFALHVAAAEDNGIKVGEGLRQGMPLSPVLSNLMLKEFDLALNRAGLSVVRYADDIAIFCHSRSGCQAALDLVRSELAQLKLTVPDLGGSKSVIYEPSEDAEFLGLEMRRDAEGYHLIAPTKKLSKIAEKMRLVASFEECAKRKRTVGQVSQTLDAMIAGHRGAVSLVANGDDFLGRLIVERKRALNELLAEILGGDVLNGLSEEKRAILGFNEFE